MKNLGKKMENLLTIFLKSVTRNRVNIVLLVIFILSAFGILSIDLIATQLKLSDIPFYFITVIIVVGLCLVIPLFFSAKNEKKIFELLKVYVLSCVSLVGYFLYEVERHNPEQELFTDIIVNAGESIIFKIFLVLSLFIIFYLIKLLFASILNVQRKKKNQFI